ncbi:MAG: YdeI/OmpD-associated family protein, partial [Microbacterium sp.]
NKPELHVGTVADWEAWLNSDPDPRGVRLRLRKKATTQPGITYAEALDVALCFGWIDGQSQSLDADYYLQTFTPRRARSTWSKVNIAHVTRLIEEGRMRPRGQYEIDRAKADGRWDSAYRQRDGDLPVELQEALNADPELAGAFASQSAQNRFAMAFRVANLKRPASRAARVAMYVEMLKRGETLH